MRDLGIFHGKKKINKKRGGQCKKDFSNLGYQDKKGECKKFYIHKTHKLNIIPREWQLTKTPLILQLWLKVSEFYCTDEQCLLLARSILVSQDSFSTSKLLFAGVPGCRCLSLFFH